MTSAPVIVAHAPCGRRRRREIALDGEGALACLEPRRERVGIAPPRRHASRSVKPSWRRRSPPARKEPPATRRRACFAGGVGLDDERAPVGERVLARPQASEAADVQREEFTPRPPVGFGDRRAMARPPPRWAGPASPLPPAGTRPPTRCLDVIGQGARVSPATRRERPSPRAPPVRARRARSGARLPSRKRDTSIFGSSPRRRPPTASSAARQAPAVLQVLTASSAASRALRSAHRDIRGGRWPARTVQPRHACLRCHGRRSRPPPAGATGADRPPVARAHDPARAADPGSRSTSTTSTLFSPSSSGR